MVTRGFGFGSVYRNNTTFQLDQCWTGPTATGNDKECRLMWLDMAGSHKGTMPVTGDISRTWLVINVAVVCQVMGVLTQDTGILCVLKPTWVQKSKCNMEFTYKHILSYWHCCEFILVGIGANWRKMLWRQKTPMLFKKSLKCHQ